MNASDVWDTSDACNACDACQACDLLALLVTLVVPVMLLTIEMFVIPGMLVTGLYIVPRGQNG